MDLEDSDTYITQELNSFDDTDIEFNSSILDSMGEEVINDYKPLEESISLEQTQQYNLDDVYLEDLSSWGRPPEWARSQSIKEELLPITFDYLRFKRDIELIWDRDIILSFELSKYYRLQYEYFSATPIKEVQDFLLKGKYLKLKDEDKVSKGFRPIEAGVLCGGNYKDTRNYKNYKDTDICLDSKGSDISSKGSDTDSDSNWDSKGSCTPSKGSDTDPDSEWDPDSLEIHSNSHNDDDCIDNDALDDLDNGIIDNGCLEKDFRNVKEKNTKTKNSKEDLTTNFSDKIEKIEKIEQKRIGYDGKSPYNEFIIIISAPNRRGDPGRLYILNF